MSTKTTYDWVSLRKLTDKQIGQLLCMEVGKFIDSFEHNLGRDMNFDLIVEMDQGAVQKILTVTYKHMENSNETNDQTDERHRQIPLFDGESNSSDERCVSYSKRPCLGPKEGEVHTQTVEGQTNQELKIVKD